MPIADWNAIWWAIRSFSTISQSPKVGLELEFRFLSCLVIVTKRKRLEDRTIKKTEVSDNVHRRHSGECPLSGRTHIFPLERKVLLHCLTARTHYPEEMILASSSQTIASFLAKEMSYRAAKVK
ncbi:hypothetical protein NPIL_468921 [Nephila pilipes]|uniref:Uncharacterized protein n=1 Tax=Nephila pilipes TaxID=299642 RepID=A0A8X6N1D5_NEPPI|nr:hypothetical protein NPIL_468921 [Nephila pilipes]